MKKIVLIEDDPYPRDFFIKRLKEEGYEPIIGDLSLQTVDMLAHLAPPPDLILIGQLSFSEKEFNILKNIKQTKTCASVPVIVILSAPTQELVFEALRMGASDVWVQGQIYEEGIVNNIEEFFAYPTTDWRHRASRGEMSIDELRQAASLAMDEILKDKKRMQRYIEASKSVVKKQAEEKVCPVCDFSMPNEAENCPKCGNATF